VKNNPVKLIPYWWNKYLKVEKIDYGDPLQVFVREVLGEHKKYSDGQYKNFYIDMNGMSAQITCW
jgi:hypothetical protein